MPVKWRSSKSFQESEVCSATGGFRGCPLCLYWLGSTVPKWPQEKTAFWARSAQVENPQEGGGDQTRSRRSFWRWHLGWLVIGHLHLHSRCPHGMRATKSQRTQPLPQGVQKSVEHVKNECAYVADYDIVCYRNRKLEDPIARKRAHYSGTPQSKLPKL